MYNSMCNGHDVHYLFKYGNSVTHVLLVQSFERDENIINTNTRGKKKIIIIIAYLSCNARVEYDYHYVTMR